MKSGFVSIIGRPNVGKSTLLNTIMERKIAIVTNKPQTTRNNIQGIYNDEEAQIVFVDTPGIHKPNHKLGNYLNKQAYYSINDVDIVLMLVDGSTGLGEGDKFIINGLKDINKPVILVINKIDKLTREQIFQTILDYKDIYNFVEIVPLSALKYKNIDELLKTIKKYLPENIKYYDNDEVTNVTNEFMIAELIREKVFNLTEEEVPHSVTCVVERIEKAKNHYHIYASIIVDRDSLKKIIIGNNGSKIKEIGIRARKDIEDLMGTKVYLDLLVKTITKWRDKEKYLNEFGFTNFDK